MDFPGIAYKTYQQWKSHPLMSNFFLSVLKKLNLQKNPIERARQFHSLVDDSIENLFENDLVSRSISCKVGCSGCCHTPVSVTSDEAQLLAKRVRDGVSISLTDLERQAATASSSLNFFALSYKNRKCVFLSENGKCSVYEDRPAVCRSNFVIGNPAQCDTSDGKEKPVRLLQTTKADLVIVAGYKSCGKAGLLPKMLHEALNKESQNSPLLLVRKDTFTEN